MLIEKAKLHFDQKKLKYQRHLKHTEQKTLKISEKKSDYSQGIFAAILNVSVKTVQSWESGDRMPSHAALRLLECVDKGFYRPKLIQKSR